MSLRNRLILFALVYLLVAGVVAAVAMNTVQDVRRYGDQVIHSNDELETFLSFKRAFDEYVIAMERWMHESGTARVESVRNHRVHMEEALVASMKLADSAEETRLLNAISDSLGVMTNLASSLMALDPNEARDEAPIKEGMKRFRHLSDDFHRVFGKLEEYASDEVRRASAASQSSQSQMYLSLLLSIGLLLLFTFYFLLRVAHWVTGPMALLHEGAGKVSEGDFSHRIDVSQGGEFGDLARSFNAMARSLGMSSERLSEKLRQSELLIEVAQVANSTLELQTILQRAVDLVAERMKRDVCSILLVSGDGNLLMLRATRGLKPESVGRASLPVGEGIVGDAVRSLRTIAVRDVTRDSRYKEIPETGEQDFRSMLATPILREGRCLGVITLQTREVLDYEPDEMNLMVLVSHSIAGAITNAELFENVRRQVDRLKVIHELGMAINSILDLDLLLRETCQKTAQLLMAEGAILRLLEGNLLYIRASYGLPESFDMTQTLTLGEGGVPGLVAREGRPILVEDTRNNPDGLYVPGLEARSILAVPLKVANRVIGTIGLYNKRVGGVEAAFTQDDLETLSAISSMAAITIENARLYRDEKIREEAIRMASQRLTTLFESVQGGIITVNREHIILSANRFVARWADADVPMVGRTCEEVFGKSLPLCQEDPVRLTFETGEPHRMIQEGASPGLFFEVSTYPMRGEAGSEQVTEVIVFIQDISDRMRSEREVLELYREVSKTKNYMESLINNSADAIVTTDMNGLVTSWNKGAERIYGFRAQEVIGSSIPTLPEFLLAAEQENSERVKRKETLRDIETLRRNRDGQLIEVSLTLSPILDERGDVIGISGISRDITDKRRVEQELTRRNQELSRLLFISNAMRTTLDIRSLLRMTLTAVTMSDGLGFNRALLFEVDEDRRVVKGVMGVGPGTLEEAWRVWGELAMERKTLEDIMAEIAENPERTTSFLDGLAKNLHISMDDSPDGVMTHVVRNRAAVNVLDARSDPRVDPVLVQQLGTEAFALIPLISRDRVLGVLWMDNLFNRRPITEDDIRFLSGFANHVASAIENARLFEKISEAEAELENIFSSISDLVYMNDPDYTIRKINKAVEEKIGLPESQIVGRKCYEVFHGMDRPWAKCPHHKTIKSGKAFIEEVVDPHLGGAFVISSSPIFGRNGEVTGTVHISRNVSESRKLREQLARAEKMAALGEMAAKIAHEIRNPLISVGGFARRLEKKLEGPLKDYATIMVDSVSHLEIILKDILGFVKETPIIVVRCDIIEILDQVLSLFSPSLKERGISIRKDYREVTLVAPVDANKIREAFTNLITNAGQALEKDGIIRVGAYRMETEAVVEVEDNGPGVAEKDLKHIFDPFFTTKMTGTGLGLAITQRILELHRGRIEVQSQVGSGTTFRVYLPLKEDGEE